MGNSNSIYVRYVKRILDISFALLTIIVFWWLYLIVAILVRVKLGSPVIFHQERAGRIRKENGQERAFMLCKFRSMSNAKDENGNLLPDNMRLTKFGRILRSTSLDELPEVWNILKGDMSIIGPRPWNTSDSKYFTDEEKRRLLVRPGLSGWAQVNGRTSASWGDRIRCDLEYVDRVSFLFDLKIIFLTVWKVVKRSDVAGAEVNGNFAAYRKKQWADGVLEMPEKFKNMNQEDRKTEG